MRCKLRKGQRKVCGRCHLQGSTLEAWKRVYQTERYKLWRREYDQKRHSPLRAAYRAIGLEAFNLSMGKGWRG